MWSRAISQVARLSTTTFLVSCSNSGLRCLPLESVTTMMTSSNLSLSGTSLVLPAVGLAPFVTGGDDDVADIDSACDFWAVDFDAKEDDDDDDDGDEDDSATCGTDVFEGKGNGTIVEGDVDGTGGADEDAILSNLEFMDCPLSFCSCSSIFLSTSFSCSVVPFSWSEKLRSDCFICSLACSSSQSRA